MYREMNELTGRVAFITGGARGIGLASAEALADAGAQVIIADRDPALLEEGRSVLAAKGHDAATVLLDVTQSDEVGRAAADCNARRGGADILIANAGITLPDRGAEDMPDEAWLHVIDVNLHGAFWCCRASGRAMLGRGRGAAGRLSPGRPIAFKLIGRERRHRLSHLNRLTTLAPPARGRQRS